MTIRCGRSLAGWLCALTLLACDDDDSSPSSEMNDGGVELEDAAAAADAEVEAEQDAEVATAQSDAASADADAGTDAGQALEFASIEAQYVGTVAAANDLRALTYAADGKIYAAGYTSRVEDDPQLVVLRFASDGSLDETFATEGVFELNLAPEGDESALGIVELANGDVVVGANRADGLGGAEIADINGGEPATRPDGQDVVLVKLTAEGELVESFGTAGVLPVQFGWSSENDTSWPEPTYDSSLEEDPWSGTGFPSDMLFDLQLDRSGEDERLVVFGFGPAAFAGEGSDEQRYDDDRYIVRLMADGSLDTEFNGDGSPYILATEGGLADNGRRGIVEDDGSIVSGGYANFGEGLGNHVVLLRLLPDGTPDADFGFGFSSDLPGLARFNPFLSDGGYAECYGVGKLSTGDYVTTGYGAATGAEQGSTMGYATTEAQDIVAFALTGEGLDTAYGLEGGLAVQSEEIAGLPSAEDRGRAVVVLPDDRAVHVGRFGGLAAVVVTTPEGQLDKAQGDNGVFTYADTEVEGQFFAAALSPDGHTVAATSNSSPGGAALALLSIAED